MKKLVLVIAAAEAATGVVVLASPSLVARLLFGSEVAGAGDAMSRIAGICLIALGAACWAGAATEGGTRPAIVGLLTYSGLVAVCLAIVAFSAGTAGPLLSPAVALHLVITALLARGLVRA